METLRIVGLVVGGIILLGRPTGQLMMALLPACQRVNGGATQYVRPMAVRRLPRGTRVDTVALGWKVEKAQKERFERLAAHAGVSSAVFFEAVVDHLNTELTSRGLPEWWPAQELTDGELPIDSP